MLIEFKGKKFIVIVMCIYKNANKLFQKKSNEDCLLCMDIQNEKKEWLKFDDVEIIDGKMPNCLGISRHKDSEGNLSICFQLNDMIVDANFWDKLDEDDPAATKKYYDFIDEIMKLHNLQNVKRPEILTNKIDILTEEERRKNDLSDELESYLDLADDDKSNGLKG